jgi:ribosome maturation factor RimP
VEITRNEGDVLTGLLKAVSETDITLLVESGKNKKKTTTEHIIPFSNIKTTRIQIVF